MNRIYGKNIKLKEITFTGDRFELTFASGAKYNIRRTNYAKAAADELVKARTDALVCEMITKTRNEYESSNTRKGKKPIFIKGVIIKQNDPLAEDDFKIEDVSNKAWDDFVFKWGDQLSFGGKNAFEPEGASTAIYKDFKSWAYTQYGKNLSSARLGKTVVLINENLPTYYYTNGNTCNGYEIWYKAINPFSFFGVAAGKSMKDKK